LLFASPGEKPEAMKVVRRARPVHEPRTRATRVVEEGRTPPTGPPLEPAPERELWPWLLLLLVLVIGGIVAAIVLTRDNKHKNVAPATVVTSQPATTVTVSRVAPKTPAKKPPTTKKPAPVVAKAKLANLVGIAGSTAVERLRKDGFQPVVRGVFSTKPRGVVAAQKPEPGTRLAKGASVTLMVSKGQPAKPVPDVVGQSESQAVSLLKAAGFAATPVEVPSSETKGNVVAQRPKAGEQAEPGTKVRLNISSGAAPSAGGSTTTAATTPASTAPAATTPARPAPARPARPATVTVPDVEGKTLQQARVALRTAGIVMEIRYVPNDQPSGTVVAQAKQPGTAVKRGDHMLVTVSQGSGATAPALVTVPNVVGQDEQAAQTKLQQAGFVAAVEDMPTSDPAQDGKVVDEQPAPGTKAPKGSQIIIYVGRATSTG
jgi:eukaryotic-like serine/threonine-protein kinase